METITKTSGKTPINIDKYNIITRKIRLFIDVPFENKELLNKYYRRLYDWQQIAFKASNLISSHLFIQEQAKELLYFHEDVKLKLLNLNKDENGMLNTSHLNSTYRAISQKFRNELPAKIINCLNHNIYSIFTKERTEYFNGQRSLRSYRISIPVPFPTETIFGLKFDTEIKNFKFTLFKSENYTIPFKTFLGKDLSGNKIIIDRCITGEYKLCNSSYTIENGKIYLLLTAKIPSFKNKLDTNKKAQVIFSFLAPLIVTISDKQFQIGDKESYLYKRLAIQHGLKRRQRLMKYNSGGKGRKKKTIGIEEFKMKEKRFINNFTHNLSKELIDLCIKHKVGTLELIDIKQTIEDVKEYPFILRNWSYGNLTEKIAYKSKLNGINLIFN